MPLWTLTCQQPVLPLCHSPWLLLLPWGEDPLAVLRHQGPSASLWLLLLVLDTAKRKLSPTPLPPLNTNPFTPPSTGTFSCVLLSVNILHMQDTRRACP